MRPSHLLAGLCLILAAPMNLSAAQAQIVRIVIDKREPVSGGGAAGYEEIRGRLFGEVDPRRAENAIIQDIDQAPRNARGKVEYISTFTLLRPIDPANRSGVLVTPLSNRGNRGVASWRLWTEIDPLYYDLGWSVLWIGWQGDLAEHPSADASAAGLAMESMLVPRARRRDGARITGRYLMRVPVRGGRGPSGPVMQLDQGGVGALSYMPADFDTRRATLTGGPSEDSTGRAIGNRTQIAPRDWKWWDCAANAAPGSNTVPADLCVKLTRGSFNPRHVYLLVFNVRDPLVLGLGLAALRDGVTFFHHARTDIAGTANPLSGRVDHVIGQGVSQVGNLAKTFIALGFNRDLSGGRVWDGVHIHIAGRRTPLNYRFSTPGSSPTLYMPGNEGVLWWGKAIDAVRGGPARSMLDRCAASQTCPQIFETFGGAELWYQRMTPGLVNFDLRRDVPLPENVRRYYLPGTQHGGGGGGFGLEAAPDNCTLPDNPNPQTDQLRALTVALVDWVSRGKAPPPSAYPMLAKGELVRDLSGSYRFPSLPGVPSPFGLSNPVLLYDFGPKFDYADLSGIITRQPPAITGVVPALVAQVDSDGNETSGVPSVQLMAPLATYLSWNTYPSGPFAGQICGSNGGFVPFARTARDRLSTGDPRPSIEERYPNRSSYIATVRAAVAKAESEGFLLRADGARLVREAIAATETGDLSFLER